MSEPRFKGICVGGSKDGQQMTAYESVIRFPAGQLSPVTLSDPAVRTASFGYETYRWNGQAFIFQSSDVTFCSFLLGRVVDGRRRIEAVREFPTEAEARADAEMRLLMFGNTGWGRKVDDTGPGNDVVVDVMGRA